MVISPEKTETEGVVVVLVGPSGAGKDTLLDWLRPKLADNERIIFARRVVTRPVQADAEDHASLTVSEFSRLEHEGGFCVVWSANGLHYGIPSSVCRHVRQGGLAILNGSRRALPEICAAFKNTVILHVSAPVSVLAERLAGRGRESREEIEARLSLANLTIDSQFNPIEIDNSGGVEIAGTRVLDIIKGHDRPDQREVELIHEQV